MNPSTAAAESPTSLPSDALRRLVENRARFLAFLTRRLGSRETAEELLQEAYVRSLDKGGSLRDGESVQAWFYRILRNALADHYRRRGAERRALEAVHREADVAEASTDEELMRTVCGCVRSLVDTLKPAYAEAIRSIDLGGTAPRAFAEAEGISPNHAAVRLHRARRALRERIRETCGTCCEASACHDCECEG